MSITTAAVYACAIAFTNVAVAYLWTQSELLSPIQAKLENCQDRWFCKLLGCAYCIGSWTYFALWAVVLWNNNFACDLNMLVAIGGGLGLYYFLWASFRKNLLPI